MAEEFFQGGVCGGSSWWNSPRNLLFSSSPCSNDLGWPIHHDPITLRSTDINDGTMPINSSDHWNQDHLLSDSGRSEENYSNFMLEWNSNSNSNSINTVKQSSFGVEQQQQQQQPPLNSSTSYSSFLQTLFETDSSPHSASNTNYPVNSNGYLLPKPSNADSIDSQFHLPPSLTNQNQLHIHSTAAKQQREQLAPVVKKASNEPAFKRSRIETPSPLPTFKVRKEKLGDRITALQQLVSPFGKTDTASVLHEAIDYIKFLHDQVHALSTPYLKYGSPPVQRQQGGKDEEKDLKSRGLCLVPISSTFPVAAETTTDFWTLPTFGGSFT